MIITQMISIALKFCSEQFFIPMQHVFADFVLQASDFGGDVIIAILEQLSVRRG
jgi:hypothetical protein